MNLTIGSCCLTLWVVRAEAMRTGAYIMAAIIIVIISLGSPITISSKVELSPILLGWPIPFMVQYQQYDPPYPWTTYLRSAWENPTQVLWANFAADVTAVWLILRAGSVLVEMARRGRFRSR